MQSFLKKKFTSLFVSNTSFSAIDCILSLYECFVVGNLLGSKALSAYAICMAPLFFIGIVRSSINVGSMYSYINAVSAGLKEKSHLYFTMGFVLSFFVGILAILGFYFLTPFYLNGLELSTEVHSFSTSFFTWFLPVLLLRPMNEFLGKLVTCDGGEKYSTVAFFISFCVILISEYVGCKFIGIGGVGLGQTIGRTVSVLIISLFFFSSRCSLKLIKKWSWRSIPGIFWLGLPYGSSYLWISLMIEVLNRFVIHYGGDAYLPIVAIFLNIYQATDLSEGALFSAVPLIDSYLYENNSRGVRKTLHLVLFSILSIGSFVMLTFALFPELCVWIAGIESGTGFYDEMCRCTRIFALFAVPLVFNNIFLFYYLVMKKKILALFAPFFSAFVGIVLWVPLFLHLFGLNGLYWGVTISVWTCSPLFMLCLHFIGRYKWSQIPFFLPDKKLDRNILIFNLYLVPGQINALLKNMDVAMKRHDISRFIRYRGKVVLREAMKLIYERNAGTDILAECTLNMNGDTVSVILKDVGIVFDLTSEEHSTKTFHSYIMGCLMNTHQDKRNQLIGGYNCNTFVWKKDAQGNSPNDTDDTTVLV